MPFVTLAFLSLAGGFVPLTYIGTCIWLFRQRVHWLAYLAYFVLFGIVGGACLALALSPSGLAAVCMVFLMTAGPVGCLACSVSLHMRRSLTTGSGGDRPRLLLRWVADRALGLRSRLPALCLWLSHYPNSPIGSPGGLPSRLPHHLTCGSASGGSGQINGSRIKLRVLLAVMHLNPLFL
jgi:hypothetical protein